jgi:hypothetical protein
MIKTTIRGAGLMTAMFLMFLGLVGQAAAQGLEPAPKLPAGMKGSNANDPRTKLKPGMYDAGVAAFGMKHVTLLQKPDAFQLGTDNADDPKVQKMLGQLGVTVIRR